jgi:hypothetical protein
MKIFTPTSPDAVRCAQCRHQPCRPSRWCESARRTVQGLHQWRKCQSFEAGLPEPHGNALEIFDLASREFDDLEAAERYVLKSFREFVWRQRQARQA